MDDDSDAEVILPKGWPERARGAFLNAVAMGRMALLQGLSGFEHGRCPDAQHFAEFEVVRARCALLEEVARIKDARYSRIPAQKRPQYTPQERLAILASRATAGWSAAQTAKCFQITPKTIASWTQRVDDRSEPELVSTREPVNKYPDFVRSLIQQFRLTQPTFGKRRIAEFLAQAGLHVAPSTVRRILDEEPPPEDEEDTATEEVEEEALATDETVDGEPEEAPPAPPAVTARYPHHLWHIDLTVVPTALGFWVSWLCNSVPIVWPFAFWVGGILDHHSRAVVATGVFRTLPTAEQVVVVLNRAVAAAGTAPKHIVSDQGSQFQDVYRAWCKENGVLPRFGAIGQHGSIAILERFWRSLKTELFRRLVIPPSIARIETELALYVTWYNQYRPHRGLRGLTPAERLDGGVPACELPRMEVRPDIPLARGDPATLAHSVERVSLVVTHLEGRKHLPIVELREAA